MGRNKNLRKKIAGHQRVIDDHEEKIQLEWTKANPDESQIAQWQREIEAAKKSIVRATRRIRREW
jgi:peptidoglycan hydrolase CwlO-like protein